MASVISEGIPPSGEFGRKKTYRSRGYSASNTPNVMALVPWTDLCFRALTTTLMKAGVSSIHTRDQARLPSGLYHRQLYAESMVGMSYKMVCKPRERTACHFAKSPFRSLVYWWYSLSTTMHDNGRTTRQHTWPDMVSSSTKRRCLCGTTPDCHPIRVLPLSLGAG